MPVQRFEDLFVWQKARALTKAVYSLTRTEALGRDFKLADQMRASG